MHKLLLFLALLLASFGFAQPDNDSLCLSRAEFKLAELINAHRAGLKLPPIALSGNLMKVARAHIHDLAENSPQNNRCNLHSWSKKGSWKGCCYTGDNRSAECMWNKPREISNYKGNGYEIAYYQSVDMSPESALEGWKSSKGHRQVIENMGVWKKVKWNAMGLAIEGEFAVVWFGKEEDSFEMRLNCPTDD